MNEEPRKSFLEEIQALDEPIKRRALVIASAVIMVIVIYVWIGYFNNIVTSGQTQAQNEQAQGQAQAPVVPQPAPANPQAVAGPSGWQKIERGMAVIGQNVGNFFGGGRQYNIRPQ